jgi:hypothetical protein
LGLALLSASLTGSPILAAAGQALETTVTSFEARAAREGVILSWINPRDPRFKTVVIRFRTDGVYPESPSDGEPLTEVIVAEPGSSSVFIHRGLGEETYHYAAFAVDDAGAASPPAKMWVALPLTTPGAVRNLRLTGPLPSHR